MSYSISNVKSTILRESGLFERDGHLNIQSPLTLIQTRKSFHVAEKIREEIKNVSKHAEGQKSPKDAEPTQEKNIQINSNLATAAASNAENSKSLNIRMELGHTKKGKEKFHRRASATLTGTGTSDAVTAEAAANTETRDILGIQTSPPKAVPKDKQEGEPEINDAGKAASESDLSSSSSPTQGSPAKDSFHANNSKPKPTANLSRPRQSICSVVTETSDTTGWSIASHMRNLSMGSGLGSERSTRTPNETKEAKNEGTVEDSKVDADVEGGWSELFHDTDWRSSQRLLELLQKGVPSSLRESLWKAFLRSETFKSQYPEGYYDSLVRLARDRGPNSEIERDLKRTMPEVPWFQTEDGQRQLSNILNAYAIRNPDIVGYCQGMNFIAAGLLTVLHEEDAFWCLCVLIEMRLGYYSPTMVSLKVDQSVLSRLLSYNLPRLSNHMEAMDISVYHFTTSWFMCLFMKSPLPYEWAVRFWDILFCYSDEVLFLMALEVIKIKEESMLEIKEEDEMLEYTLHPMTLKEFRQIDFSKIVKNVGSLSVQIRTLRSYYQKALSQELSEAPSDASSLAEVFKFSSKQEVSRLWRLFCGINPWNVLLTGTHTEVSSLADALHRACYSNEPDKFCAHGLMSGFMHRMFDVLDQNNTCNVTFKQYLRTVQTLSYGSQEDRLRLCFRFFDFDGDGAVGFSDLKFGIRIVADMINKNSASQLTTLEKECEDMMQNALSEEKYVTEIFERGPFYLKMGTEGLFPKVKQILDDSTARRGIRVGWELVSINQISLLQANDERIYSVLSKVEFPASLKFRFFVSSPIEFAEKKESFNMEFESFSRVIRSNEAVENLFRLHGDVYDWLDEEQKHQTCMGGMPGKINARPLTTTKKAKPSRRGSFFGISSGTIFGRSKRRTKWDIFKKFPTRNKKRPETPGRAADIAADSVGTAGAFLNLQSP